MGASPVPMAGAEAISVPLGASDLVFVFFPIVKSDVFLFKKLTRFKDSHFWLNSVRKRKQLISTQFRPVGDFFLDASPAKKIMFESWRPKLSYLHVTL
jgi:hypothetical protein